MIVKNRNSVGGGVAIYYRSVLNVMNRQDLIPANVEAVCLEVTRPKSKPILITSVYRPPNSRIELLTILKHYFRILMYYLKNEQECFIRFKATSAQREWLLT
jgi:hypothetical protein